MIEETLGELLLHRLDVLLVQVGADESDAAVDVEADATCRNKILTIKILAALIPFNIDD